MPAPLYERLVPDAERVGKQWGIYHSGLAKYSRTLFEDE